VTPMLYRVGPRDLDVCGGALAVMAAVSLAACLLPARRAMRTDPALAIRQ
jgi:ABC-type lipoprotein release transport system permease subunit